MIENTKVSFLKLFILLLLTVKATFFLSDSFSKYNIENVINSCPDEIEIEVESATTFFQKISKCAIFLSYDEIVLEAPIFKNTFSQTEILLESITPPPEFIF